jgi:hypothetical protein
MSSHVAAALSQSRLHWLHFTGVEANTGQTATNHLRSVAQMRNMTGAWSIEVCGTYSIQSCALTHFCTVSRVRIRTYI